MSMSGYSGERDEDTDQSSPFPPYQTSYPGTRDRSFGRSDPFLYLLTFATSNLYPRRKRQQKEDKSDKDEFDNGYSAKIREITEDESYERTQPISQLMEKTSKRCKEPLDSIWCKQQENIKDEEEEIRNTFEDDDADSADLEVDGEYRYPHSYGGRKSEESRLPTAAEEIIRFLTGQGNNSKATITNERENKIKCEKEPVSEPVSNTVNNFPSEPSRSARTKNQTSSNSNDSLCKERTLYKSMNETQESMLNSSLKLKGEIQKNTDPDPIVELANNKFNGESVGKNSTDSSSSYNASNDLSSQETESANESESTPADYVDDIDEMAYDEDEMYTGYGDYNVNDTIPTVPESVRKAHDTKALGENAGRYSEGIHQYVNMPTFMQSIRKFAFDNHFELENVISDGNCMFRAIVDQLNVNGDLGYTPQSLRLKAVRYLRQHPYQSDGSRLEDFLSTETWEQYLLRMEQNSQWGDHMILKAIVDALNLVVVVFNVYEDDIRRTEILPEGYPITKRQQLTIYLGHIGEFHYLSLRQMDWEIFWPFKSLIRRFQVFIKSSKPSSSTSHDLHEKIKNMGNSKFLEGACLQIKSPADNTTQTANLDFGKVQMVDLQPEQSKSFVRYGLSTLQLDETKESLNSLLDEPTGIDSLTGLPLPHFTYIIKELLSVEILTFSAFNSNKRIPTTAAGSSFTFEMYGSSTEGVNVCMVDHSKEQKMQYFEEVKRFNVESILLCDTSREVLFAGETSTDTSRLPLFADTTNSHAGYCRLIPGFPKHMCIKGELFSTNSEVYLKSIPIPSTVRESMSGLQEKKLGYGYQCLKLPYPARKWQSRQRKCQWPPDVIIREIMSGGCLLKQRAHPNSALPEVEWKFVFSNAEQILMKRAFSPNQLKVFKLYKVLVEYMTRHLDKTLKHNHLKNTFFYASENIAQESWEDNVGGCLLFVFGYLLDCLKNKTIPHYFISENNLLDCYSEKEIQTISTYIEAFRVLPVQCLENMYFRHGWKRIVKELESVLRDCQQYSQTRDINHSWLNVFHPTSLKTVLALADKGFYEIAFESICTLYDDLKRSPLREVPSFEDIFQDAIKRAETSSARQALAKLYDEKYGTSSMTSYQKTIGYQQKRIGDAVPFSVDERIRDVVIPNNYSKNDLTIVSWLDSTAYSYYTQCKYEMAQIFIQTAIKFAKHMLKEQNEFDISEIKDTHLKTEIARERSATTSGLLAILTQCYYHLFVLCTLLQTGSPFDEHMANLEDIQYSVEGMDKFLAKVRLFRSKPSGPMPSFIIPDGNTMRLVFQ